MEHNNSKLKITAIAILFNNENIIKEYINELLFVNEIIIIDCNSTDKTKKIAIENGAIVHDCDFENYSNQLTFAISKSTNDWIICLDINEKIITKNENDLEQLDLTALKTHAFSFNKDFFFLGKKIKFGSYDHNDTVKIFNKKYFIKDNNFDLKNSSSIKKVEKNNKIIFQQDYNGFDNYNNKLSFNANLQAEKMFFYKKRPFKFHFFLRPTYRFFWHYILKLGFLDGKEGFILANIHAFAAFKKYLLLWMKYRKIEK